MRGGAQLLAVLGVVSSVTHVAHAATCLALRPTSAVAAWSYAGAAVSSLATPEGNFRVWYAESGKHAATPQSATAAGAAAEAGLARYAELGFRAPLADTINAACPDDGGDERFDIYLFDFNAADGTVQLDRCRDDAPELCAGFMIVENDFATGAYASVEEGFRTVVPHELFHLVQHAYSSNDEAWWNEGSAQWATQQVFPELTDLESFLPAFFQRPGQALDIPAGGAAAAFSYGAAIWPIFLSERFGPATPRAVFEELGDGADSVLSATAPVLDTELSSAFAEFARWNAATGARAASDGYSHAVGYPEVAFEPLESPLRGKLAGLAARYFLSEGGAERELKLSGNADRVQAWFLPLEDGKARLMQASVLPATSDASGVVVVTGKALDHRDVSFTLEVSEVVPSNAGAGGATGDFDGASDTPPASSGGRPSGVVQGGAAGEETGAPMGGDAPSTPTDEPSPSTDDRSVVPSSTSRTTKGCSVASGSSRFSNPFYALGAASWGAARLARRRAGRAHHLRSVTC